MSLPEKLAGRRLLLALRLGLPEARQRVLDELTAQGGHVLRTAAALGVGAQTLRDAARGDDELGAGWRAGVQGRAGSSRLGVAARLAKKNGARKSAKRRGKQEKARNRTRGA